MSNQAISDAVAALLAEVQTIKTDFDGAISRIQSQGLTGAEVVAELQPISDALGAVDASMNAAGVPAATTTTTTTPAPVAPTTTDPANTTPAATDPSVTPAA